VREACAVANASGAALDPEFILGNVSKLPPQMRSSMQKDVAAGRPPELDAIAGQFFAAENNTTSRRRQPRGWSAKFLSGWVRYAMWLGFSASISSRMLCSLCSNCLFVRGLRSVLANSP
jgi:hypothetical protein